ncbi:MAG: hypothetical protein HY722_11045 [Planctomycetes bacterium]|nr:hypothetical protein [Planctomycetota bacterium]
MSPAAGAALLVFAGALWVRTLGLRRPVWETAALAFLLGVAWVGWVVFLAAWAGVRPAWGAVAALAVAPPGVALWLGRAREVEPAGRPWDLRAAASAAVTALPVLLALPRSVRSSAEAAWDGWAIWDLKARAFLAQGLAAPAWTAAPELAFSHPDYPLGYPLARALLGGEPAARLLGPCFLLAAGWVVQGSVLRRHGVWAALVAGLAVTTAGSAQGQAPLAMADLPLAAYLALATAAFREGRPALAAAALAAAAWTKQEGLATALAGVFLLARRGAWPWAALLAGALVPWPAFSAVHGLRSDLLAGAVFPADLARPVEAMGLVVREALRLHHHGAVLAAALVGVILAGGRGPRGAWIPAWHLAACAGALGISAQPLPWLASVTVERLVMQAVPAAALVAAWTLGPNDGRAR